MSGAPDPMVSTAWLAERLKDPDVLPIDSSWWFPHERRDAAAEFLAVHIPGAVFFDIDAVADTRTDLPHMLPSADAFAAAAGALGVGSDVHVVVYESGAPRAAGRLWWMLHVFGHSKVSVLDGGLPRWRAEGRDVERGPPDVRARRFQPRYRPSLVRDSAAIHAALEDPRVQIVDARPAARFRGEVDEPRPNLRRGHMPGARSLPASELFDAEGMLIEAPRLRARLAEAGVDAAAGEILASCGSGITAGLVALALARLGRFDVAVYDGSWAEWGALPAAPVALP